MSDVDPVDRSTLPNPEDEEDTRLGPAPIGVPRTMLDKDGNVVPFTVSQTRRHTSPTDRPGTPFQDVYTRQIEPRYYVGDEYAPANFSSNEIFQLQQYLAKVGLLTSPHRSSVWDSPTRNAYKQLLGLANAKGLDANQTLQGLLQEGPRPLSTVDEFGNVIESGVEAPRAPLTIRQTDPAALRRTFREAVINMLGEGWSQEKINNMVAAYHKVEADFQREAYALEPTGGGTITEPPDPTSFIQEQVQEQDPVGVQSQEALGFVNDFMNLASSPAWGVG